jgi:hypothetical protein
MMGLDEEDPGTVRRTGAIVGINVQVWARCMTTN